MTDTASTAHTSFWDKVKNVEHNFLAWWAKEYEKFQKDEPKIEQALDVAAKYAVPALNIALAAAGGPAGVGVEAAQIIAEAQTGITVASSLVHDFGPTPDAAGVLSGVKSSLSGILDVLHVKNATTTDAITKVVNLVDAAASGLASAAAAQTQAQPAA